MKTSVRSVLTTSAAVMTAVTVAVAPSVKEPPPTAPERSVVRVLSPDVQLTAAVQPRTNPIGPQPAQSLIEPAALPNLLAEWLRRIAVPPSASAPFPTPQFPPVVGGNSVQSLIKNTYNAIEPWVRWGFEVAAYAVGWVPWVGWLAPQIMIFYDLGERIVRSITFNIADWIGGDVSFAQGLINVGIDTINSFIFFANDQLAFWLPPLPPIPPIGPFAAAETAELMAATVEETTEAQLQARVDEKLDAVDPETLSADAATEIVEPVVETETKETETLAIQTEQTETLAIKTEQTETLSIKTEDSEDEETRAEETAPLANEAEGSENAETQSDKKTTTSSGAVQAQGEVRGAGIGASPGKTATRPESPTTDDADEPDQTQTSATTKTERDDNAPNADKADAGAEERSARRIHVPPQHHRGR